MRIAFFTDSYLPVKDGVVSSILTFRKGLKDKGHRAFVFAPELGKADDDDTIYRFPSVTFPPYPDYRLALHPKVTEEIAKKVAPDIIHCKAMTTMAIEAADFSKRKGIPAIASLETMVPEGMHYISESNTIQRFGKTAAWSYLRWLYKKFPIITAPSKHAQKILEENGIESRTLPSPIDTERFRPSQEEGEKIRKRLGIENKKVILSVGRVVKEKNYSLLIETAKLLPDGYVFVIVGKGPYLESIKQEAKGKGAEKKFIFTGFVEERELVPHYNAADAFVFPSGFETQGLTLLEALAVGKPACVLKDTPMEEIIGGSGFAFSNESEDCAGKLMKCMEHSESLKKNARKAALEYSIPKCTEKLLALYEEAMRSPP